MDKKLLWFLNVQVCVLILLTLYNLMEDASGGTVTATGGNVDSVISVHGDRVDTLEKAKKRGYYTAKEYAEAEGVNLETVYRRLDAGLIQGAEKVNHRWRLPCL